MRSDIFSRFPHEESNREKGQNLKPNFEALQNQLADLALVRNRVVDASMISEKVGEAEKGGLAEKLTRSYASGSRNGRARTRERRYD